MTCKIEGRRVSGSRAGSSGSGVSLPVVDSTSIVQDVTDSTKQIRLDAGGLPTSTIGVIALSTATVNLNQDLSTTSSVTFAGVDVSSNKITNLAAPTVASDAANKDYVDSAIQGLVWQDPVLDELDFTTAEPVGPTTGDRYINTTTGTSNGTSQAVTANYIYEWNGSNWDEFIPTEGYAAWVQDIDVQKNFNGTSWVRFGSTVNHNNLSGLQGGTTGEYFHLTSAQHTNINNTITGDKVVNIDGGAIDGTVIGATTPAAGMFTTLNVESNVAGYAATFFNDGNSFNRAGILIKGGQDNGVFTAITFQDGNASNSEIIGFNQGNLGIGKDNPSAKFDIAVNSASGTSDILKFDNTNTGNELIFREDADNGKITLRSSGSIPSLAIAFGGAESVLFKNNGNVGIGTTSPTSLISGKVLEVTGASVNSTVSVRATDAANDRNAILELLSSGNGGSNSAIIYGDTDTTPGTPSDLRFIGYHNGNQTTHMTLDSSGNVGIGTTNPTFDLGIGTSTSETWSGSFNGHRFGAGGALWHDNGVTGIWSQNVYHDGASRKYLANGSVSEIQLSGGQILFYRAPSGTAGNAITLQESMRIDSSGNVGIGTASPNTLLDVDGGTSFPIRNITSSFTATTSDRTIVANATTGNIVITLPPASSAYNSTDGTGLILEIKRDAADASGNTVTIDGNGSELIDNALTVALAAAESARIQSDGTEWYLL